MRATGLVRHVLERPVAIVQVGVRCDDGSLGGPVHHQPLGEAKPDIPINDSEPPTGFSSGLCQDPPGSSRSQKQACSRFR